LSEEFVLHTGGVVLSGEDSGPDGERDGARGAEDVGRAGPAGGSGRPGRRRQPGCASPVVLLHGLTATRRYVAMGSTLLQRTGHRVIAYDARGHGRSTPAPDRAYDYELLARDLLAVLDAAGVRRATLAGVSMGAHTAVRFALQHPQRVAGLALVTPAYKPSSFGSHADLARWDALALGLREGGVEGFVRANDLTALPPAWHETVETALRQRIAAHEHPDAVADALESVPRSRPFEDIGELATIGVPTTIVASRDEADPTHPLAVGERYAQTIPGAQLIVEDAGPPPRSPIAWQGGQLSKIIAEVAAEGA
jgi:pimeloyl-ACP methyl ester carboxylesterase